MRFSHGHLPHISETGRFHGRQTCLVQTSAQWVQVGLPVWKEWKEGVGTVQGMTPTNETTLEDLSVLMEGQSQA